MHSSVKYLTAAITIALVMCAPAYGAQVSTQPNGQRKNETSPGSKQKKQKKPQTLSTIIVSGSRINLANVTTVTPVISFSPENLRLSTYTNVGNALYDLPYVSADRGPASTGTNTDAGSSPIDLRGLGTQRTLTLVDGHRVLSANDGGTTDLNSIPSILIQRVDVVTGGASAAYGSDAVAGVVNILLNHDFNGVEAEAGYGESTYGDDHTFEFRAAAGTDFAGGKGHFEIGGDFAKSGGITRASRPHTVRWSLLPTSSGALALTPNTGDATDTLGGLILTGVLAGQQFGPGGVLENHDIQTIGGVGIGSPAQAPNSGDYSDVVDPDKHYTVLANVSYKLSDNLNGSITLRHFDSSSQYPWFDVAQHVTINRDNAFLPSAVASAMDAAGETSFELGRFSRDINYPTMIDSNKANQLTLDLNGVTKNLWHWDAYVSHAQSDLRQDTPGFFIIKNLAQAVDAVIDPATGQPVCRVALTNPSSNCVPINLFGVGAPSQAAQNYVTGAPHEHATRTLDQFGYSVFGEPWELPAGYVSVAAGVEARREKINQRVGQLDLEKAYSIYFYNPEYGSSAVKEAFGEINVPLLVDKPGFKNTAIDVAARISDYDHSGNVWSWKAGLTNDFGDGFRVRIAESRDIRAPDLNELFLAGTQGYNDVYDPVLNQTYLVLDNAGGNLNLKPEKADTFTAGLSWSPINAATGLLLNADYYNIKVKNVITTIGTQETIDFCQAGDQSICGRIQRGPGGKIVQINSEYVNLAGLNQDGVDLQAVYSWDGSLFGVGGRFQTRTVATWVHKDTRNDGQTTTNLTGSVGNSFVDSGVPRWRGVSSISFTARKFSLNARLRYFSAGYNDTTQNIVNNRIPQYFYFDLGGAYRLGNTNLQLYADVRNIANRKPPIATGYNPFYDVVGRFWMVGLRMRFGGGKSGDAPRL